MIRKCFLRSDIPQSDKLRGRGDQLSLLSPPRFLLNLTCFRTFFCLSLGVQRDKDRHTLPSGSVSVLVLTCFVWIVPLPFSLHLFVLFLLPLLFSLFSLLLYTFHSNFSYLHLSSSCKFPLLNILIPVA